jgi:2-methylisocitrate lyase-like PEP mutase family enzyme
MSATRPRATLKSALAAERPLVTPLAHDALSARLIERAGFRAFNIGGSAMLAARYGLPDLGIAALGEMVDGIRDIAAASTLPFFADGDDGYGDVKSVARTVEAYERLGVGGVLIEDQQRERKQQRADGAKGVVSEAEINAKLKTALAARTSADTLIVGRTDAYAALGLDAAIKRAEGFLKLGADGIFIAGLKTVADFERVGNAFRGELLMSAIFEGVNTPWLAPKALGEMGFAQVAFPATLIFRTVAMMRETLAALRAHGSGEAAMAPSTEAAQSRQMLDDALEVARWQEIERGSAS